MPVYEYLCDDCGGFSEFRPMSMYDAPHPCPSCEEPARRAILTAPAIGACSSEQRKAHRRNEAAVEAPKRGRAAAHGHHHHHKHAHPGKSGKLAEGRPWMLSH